MSYRLHVRTKAELTPVSHHAIHATNVLHLDTNRYLIVWFGGSREKHPDTAIWSSIYNYEDGQFTIPVKIAKISEVAHWNPILMRDGQRILCYFKVGVDCSNWRTWIMESKDGWHWGRPSLLVHGDKSGRGPSKTKPIIMSNGDWLAPCSSELNGWHSYADISTDRGKTWQISKAISVPPDVAVKTFRGTMSGMIIQPAIWETFRGHLNALIRSNTGYLWQAKSIDYGRTWSEPEETSIPNNNSGIDVINIPRGTQIQALVYNPVAANWGARTPLSVSMSYDGGNVWRNPTTIEDSPGEFSYPSMIAHEADGSVRIVVSYTRFRRSIGLAVGHLIRTQSKIRAH